MKYLIGLFFLLLGNGAFSQIVYPEIMEARPSYFTSLKAPGLVFPSNLSHLKRKLKYTYIENPQVRYAIQNLQTSRYSDPELKSALKVLLKYAQNDTLKKAVDYLKSYVEMTGKNEDALKKVFSQLAIDSVKLYARNIPFWAGHSEVYFDSDLKTLASYIREDTNYKWLKKISRDSVILEVLNAADQSIKFWINNGQEEYYRFWALTKSGDSIGTWIQAVPGGNHIRVYLDEDVYRIPKSIDSEKVKGTTIFNNLDSAFFNMQGIESGKLYRPLWRYYTEVEAAFGQGYQSNWASGGENSLSLLTNIRYYFNYNKNKTSWENFVYYRLGFLRSGREDLRKNEDRLEFNSKLGQQAFKHWYYTAQLNIQTLLFNSYEYPSETERKLVGNFMSPGYFTLSLGIDYKPNADFSLYLSPIAGKWTWVRDTNGIDPTRYGVDAGKKSKGDAGARIELRNKFKLFTFMDIRNELIMFSSYYNSKQRFTADWKVQIDFKINYFMRASVYTNAVYDQNYSDDLQFKETLNLGINFRF